MSDLRTGLIGHWPLTGKTLVGGRAHDLAAGRHGRAVHVTGADNWAEFAGGDSCVVVAPDAIHDFGDGPFSAACWFNADDREGGFLVMKGAQGAGGRRYDLHALPNGRMRFCIDDDSGDKRGVNSAELYVPGRWYHLVGVRAESALHVYVNGQPVPDSPIDIAGYGSIDDATKPLAFAIDSTHLDSDSFAGKLREVRLYDRALSPEDVSALFAATAP